MTFHGKKAFTLVEVLAVLVLLSLMAAMVITATDGVTESARETRTKKIIAAIDSVLQEKYQSYRYRPMAVEIPDTYNPASMDSSATNPEIGFDVLASEAARVRMMMIRDLQRMELPDRLSDIGSAPMLIRAAASPILRNGTTDAILSTRADKSQRRMFPVSWYNSNATYASSNDNVPGKMAAYRERIQAIESLSGNTFNFTSPSTAQLANQGAECLYLIMATSYVSGAPAVNVIPAANIGDTDNDGLLEILDGWGRPLGFIRWPVGYFDFEASLDRSVPDDFDLFRTDYAYVVDTSISTDAIPTDVLAATADPNLKPWSIRPLIFSFGPDGNAGIATNPFTPAGAEQTNFSYQDTAWNWPVDANHYGTQEFLGRARGSLATTYANHPYPDPYLRKFVEDNGGAGFTGRLPGQVLGATGATNVADNITNYQLQATPR